MNMNNNIALAVLALSAFSFGGQLINYILNLKIEAKLANLSKELDGRYSLQPVCATRMEAHEQRLEKLEAAA